MPEKIDNFKEDVTDFCNENAGAIMIGIYGIATVVLCVGTFVFAKKAVKWQGQILGKEIAKALKK